MTSPDVAPDAPTSSLSTRWDRPAGGGGMRRNVALECGWGRLLFGQTFAEHERLFRLLRDEEPGRRDICLYPRDPHVLVARAPQELFVDPSYTFRRYLDDLPEQPTRDPSSPVDIRPLRDRADVEVVNALLRSARMVPCDEDVLLDNAHDPVFCVLVAEERGTGRVIGTVTGVDHVRAFGDPEGGTSLWCLVVDAKSALPAVGASLVEALLHRYARRGRAYLDLSVLHDNDRAIKLYERMGFVRVPVLAVKRKNVINEPLFSGPPSPDYDRLNPYARIIADEARRRGIRVDVLDAEWGEMRLSHGGRQVVTRESLSELTSAVAMSRCDDKRITRRVLEAAGLRVARGRPASGDEDDVQFLHEVGELVVKPARGEQGRGITVGVRHVDHLRRAVAAAQQHCPDVLLEECVAGEDLRIVVINHEVVAAAIRRPARVVGDGRSTVARLITAQSRRRAAATGGESQIPLDETTRETVRAAGWDLADVLPAGLELAVRRTANLHTGGTIHDVTDELHPALAEAAVRASRALDIPVTGLDLLVPDVAGPEHVFVEANERPGLANHEPQPTAERFVDLLFPETAAPRP